MEVCFNLSWTKIASDSSDNTDKIYDMKTLITGFTCSAKFGLLKKKRG